MTSTAKVCRHCSSSGSTDVNFESVPEQAEDADAADAYEEHDSASDTPDEA